MYPKRALTPVCELVVMLRTGNIAPLILRSMHVPAVNTVKMHLVHTRLTRTDEDDPAVWVTAE